MGKRGSLARDRTNKWKVASLKGRQYDKTRQAILQLRATASQWTSSPDNQVDGNDFVSEESRLLQNGMDALSKFCDSIVNMLESVNLIEALSRTGYILKDAAALLSYADEEMESDNYQYGSGDSPEYIESFPNQYITEGIQPLVMLDAMVRYSISLLVSILFMENSRPLHRHILSTIKKLPNEKLQSVAIDQLQHTFTSWITNTASTADDLPCDAKLDTPRDEEREVMVEILTIAVASIVQAKGGDGTYVREIADHVISVSFYTQERCVVLWNEVTI